MDLASGVIPSEIKALVSATPSCVAVGTLCEIDGETTISLSDEGVPPGFGPTPVFDGVLQTDSKKLSVCNVLLEVLLEIDVPSKRTRLQIWANDTTSEPDSIAIIVVRG
jgi:hypothetical protein